MDDMLDGYSELADAAVESAARLSGAASFIKGLEDSVVTGEAVTAEQLVALRCIVEACACELDSAWRKL